MSDVPFTSIPSSWIWSLIQDVATTATGGTPSRSISEYFGGSIPWVKSGELGDGHVFETEETLSELGLKSSNAKLFPKGTLCIALYGATVGKLGILEVDAATNQAVCGLFLPDEVHRDFVFYYLASIRRDLIEQGKGGAQSNISNGLIRQTWIPIAPFNEQRRIVAKIEELFSDLDAGVAALKRAKANLKRYRASVLKAAVEGKLTEEWRAKHPAKELASALLARILKERRQKWEADQLAKFASAKKEPPKNWREKYKEPAQPEASQLPILPIEWIWASVEQISSKVVDGVHKKPTYVNEGVPFVTVRNLTAGPGISFGNLKYVTLADHQEFIKRANPEMGDVLITKDGTLGVTRAVRTDTQFSIFVSVALVKPVQRESSGYLEIAFMSPTVQRQMVGKGSGLQHIHLEDLRQDCVPLPSELEQQQIVTLVAEKLSQIDATEKEIEHGLLRASRLRQSILKQAFEGKLVPQDPKDEPASVLLERLRASRAHDEANGTAATSKRTRAKIKESSGKPRTRIRRGPSSQNQQEE